jgi:hypothetical protein
MAGPNEFCGKVRSARQAVSKTRRHEARWIVSFLPTLATRFRGWWNLVIGQPRRGDTVDFFLLKTQLNGQ